MNVLRRRVIRLSWIAHQQVIPRNTPLPTRQERIFSTYADNQTAVDVIVFEGERSQTRENNLLGKFELTDLPKMPRRKPQIVVTFDIDANGILAVSAMEKTTGRRSNITITNDSGRLSSEEIERMMDDAERYRLEDQERMAEVKARHDLENYAYGIRSSLSNGKSRGISKQDTERLTNAVAEALEWLEMNSDKSITDDFVRKRLELEQVCSGLVPI